VNGGRARSGRAPKALLECGRDSRREPLAAAFSSIRAAHGRAVRTRRAGAGGEAGAGAAAGRRTLDFESLAFAQGGHLMANKKCDLPKGSYRTAFKARARRLCRRPLGPAACSRAARASSVGRGRADRRNACGE
jgi:hypothetical protein